MRKTHVLRIWMVALVALVALAGAGAAQAATVYTVNGISDPPNSYVALKDVLRLIPGPASGDTIEITRDSPGDSGVAGNSIPPGVTVDIWGNVPVLLGPNHPNNGTINAYAGEVHATLNSASGIITTTNGFISVNVNNGTINAGSGKVQVETGTNSGTIYATEAGTIHQGQYTGLAFPSVLLDASGGTFAKTGTSGMRLAMRVNAGEATRSILSQVGTVTKPGYVLAGWSTAPGGTTVDYAVGAESPQSVTKLYAVWQDATGLASLTVGGVNVPVTGTSLSVTLPATADLSSLSGALSVYDAAASVQLNSGALTHTGGTGYTFSGVSVPGSGGTFTITVSLGGADTVYTVTVHQSAQPGQTYTLLLDANGGAFSGGETVTLIGPSLTFNLATAGTPKHPQGLTLLGWLDSGGALHTATYTAAANGETLTASWGEASSGGEMVPVDWEEEAPFGDGHVVVNCDSWVNVRSGPGLEHDVIGRAYLHEPLEPLQWNEDGTWCRALYNNGNKVGWIFHEYIGRR